MSRPVMRTEGLVLREMTAASGERVMAALVQCDLDEAFYRFPGGSVEFGEAAAVALVREFKEEYDLPVQVGGLAVIDESMLHYGGRDHHFCTLLHFGELAEADVRERYLHREHDDIQMVWRTFAELQQRPTYPEGIVEYLLSGEKSIRHFVRNELVE